VERPAAIPQIPLRSLEKKFGAFCISVSKVGLPDNWPRLAANWPGLTSGPLGQIGHLGTSEDTNSR
jgi:hypothetical protein